MRSQSSNAEAWNSFADAGRALLVSAAVLAPLFRRDFKSSFDGLTAILATSSASKAIKAFWREPRPNGENANSFPSQHAAECFAAAVILDRVWPDRAGPAATGCATAIATARVFSGKHHPADVLAGGAVGILVANLTTEGRRPR